MRLALLLLLAGCRFILAFEDPVRVDAGGGDTLDARPVDPTQLAIDHVSAPPLREGTGTAGGRPALLVVHGHDIAADATVAVHSGVSLGPDVTVDLVSLQVSTDGTLLAVPVTLPVDAARGANTVLMLDVTVSQLAGTVTATMPASVTWLGFDELTGSADKLPSGVHEFSQIDLPGNLTFEDVQEPLVVRSWGGLTIAGTIDVSGNGQSPGPAGGGGGAGGSAIGGVGKIGNGAGAGKPSGGGGGFGTAGQQGAAGGLGGDVVGQAALPALASPNRGSGGAGGNGNGGPSPGGAGGGGGGTIELVAGGMMMLGNVVAAGGNGASGANPGGGGSGGAVLVRAPIALTASSINAKGGGGAGAFGGDGRVRVDATVATIVGSVVPTPYHGPTFDPTTPLIARDPTPTIRLFGQANTLFALVATDEAGNTTPPQSLVFGATGVFQQPLPGPLQPGRTLLCAIVEGGDLAIDESKTCIEVVYLP